ncbi:hypothetical protein CsSME_00053371 [Camellia sinensis var. sinensis]
MVSIVSHVFSLASYASDPVVPFFSRETIVHAIQTVVDGFLDMEDCPRSFGVVDKMNIFRPDRVFMFIIEMHYKVTAAVHYRHKCHRLAGIEVLVSILGHRAALPSTFNGSDHCNVMSAQFPLVSKLKVAQAPPFHRGS